MMSTIEQRITEIQHWLAKGEAERPERALEELIRQMGSADLSEWRREIQDSIQQFRPKRRRNLSRILESKAGGGDSARVPDSDAPSTKPTQQAPARASASAPDPEFAADFRRALDALRQRHIFQWSTFYRDCLSEYFGRFLDEVRRVPAHDSGRSLTEPLVDHTLDAFSQGYGFTRGKHDHREAVRKSLNGLSRFLALPLDFYSIRSSASSDHGTVSALRLLVSASVSGILEGYSSASFGQQTGSAVLPRFERSWLHYMAFLTPRHAEGVIDRLEAGPLADGLRTSVLPLLDALQQFHDQPDDEFSPLPVAGQYMWQQRRLDITVRPPRNAASQRLIEVNAFLDDGFVSTADLDDAARRQVTLVIAPLKPDVRKVASERMGLAEIVVPAGEAREETANQAFRVWNAAVRELRSTWSSTAPLVFNFAREFPLHDQNRNRATVFHVARTSVRDLLRTFERRNGVRLWCSVRRSGKTTACLDLDSTSGDSTIVSQTCGVAPSPDDTSFFQSVRVAVENGGMISGTFVQDAVAACAPPRADEHKRLVLVIDEYDALFGLLRTAVDEKASIRHTVVQPILNQLMTFSYDNLLVFLGQPPDAHFILMDQNQLAPYVQQDPFPLFEHAPQTTTGEFSELVRKILAERIEYSARFLDALFEETAGHPYLTANVLGEFVEWLIETRRPQLGLRVKDTDFAEFADQKLNTDRILLSPDYDFFRHAAAEAMSAPGYWANPWLFTAYWVLRELSNDESSEFRVERAGFPELMRRIPVPQGEPVPDFNETLRSASQANFLSYDDDWVRVRIPTLGRIAAAVRPRVT